MKDSKWINRKNDPEVANKIWCDTRFDIQTLLHKNIEGQLHTQTPRSLFKVTLTNNPHSFYNLITFIHIINEKIK